MTKISNSESDGSVGGDRRWTEFEIRVNDLGATEVIELLSEHLRSLGAVSPPGSCHALNVDKLRAPGVTFWTVWDGDHLLGCGALKELDPGHGEVKSMRTANAHLRRGAASVVLEHIVGVARRRGYKKLSLETGAGGYFAAAHGLYKKFGFRDCAAFGDYRPDENSRFMTMEL